MGINESEKAFHIQPELFVKPLLQELNRDLAVNHGSDESPEHLLSLSLEILVHLGGTAIEGFSLLKQNSIFVLKGKESLLKLIEVQVAVPVSIDFVKDYEHLVF